MINEAFRSELKTLADAVSTRALYEEHPVYGLVPQGANLDERSWGTISDIYGDIKHTVLGMAMMQALTDKDGASKEEQIERAITQNTPYDSFSLLSQETATIVLLGKSENSVGVLRVSPHPESQFVSLMSTRRDDSIRTEFQSMLQGKQKPVNVGNVLQVEVTPFGQVAELSGDEKKTFGKFLHALTEDTCYQPDDLKEVMLLPDATMVMFDCGECKYAPDFWDMSIPERMAKEDESKNLIEMRLKSWDLPEQFISIDRDGGLKQDRFFPPFQDDIRMPDHTPKVDHDGFTAD